MKILITGTSTGFGKLITETLLEEGHQVAATMRNSQNKNKASALALTTAGATVIDLDVADDGSVALGVQDAIDALGGIDVVINNAGVSMIGLQETFTIDDWKKVFEINVFGVQRVNRAVLPLLREQGSGLLIHISSVVGRVNLPFFGPYTASKWALEALVEGYRAELPGFGIESILVEPGGFPTEIFDKMSTPSDKKRVRDYGKFANAPKKFFLKFARSLKNTPEQKSQDVADVVAQLIAIPAGQRPFRTVVDKMGMAEALAHYNQSHEELTAGLYKGFGIADMLKVKVPTA